MRAAWFLNLDAERELEDPAAFHPDPAARFRKYFAMTGLAGPDDVIVTPETRLDRSYAGRAWCPTPRAIGALENANVKVPRSPGVEVLRRVNDRAFCFALGDDFPGVARVSSDRELTAALSFPAPRFVLKRAFGFTGKGRRLVGPDLDAGDRAFAAATFARGHALIVEPWVERADDFGLHGHLTSDGALTAGEPTAQEVSANGQWIRSRRADEKALFVGERNALISALEATARALHAAGYFGPFGIDAFRWVSASGQTHFRARCEINARYSMGWATGMGARRPADA